MSDPLLTLQDQDTALDDLRRRLGSLPERAAAHSLNERRHACEAVILGLDKELEQLSAQEAQVEVAMDTAEKRAASLDATLRAPGAGTRDAQAIIHEVDQLRARAAVFEEQGLELLEQRDTLLAQRAASQQELDAIAAEVPKVLAALSAAEGDAGEARQTLETQRQATAAALDPDVLATYERLRARLDGVAVARVHSGACTGCHLALSAADLDRFNHLPAGGHATCEQCGRLLVRE
ncbi:MAG TPA: hypothetical protein VMZ22_02615 [Acidimicrobiales bacterium]|nr:hypothetical protein [Acidimicrobiales bacterium]